jgi:hypothetical protein
MSKTLWVGEDGTRSRCHVRSGSRDLAISDSASWIRGGDTHLTARASRVLTKVTTRRGVALEQRKQLGPHFVRPRSASCGAVSHGPRIEHRRAQTMKGEQMEYGEKVCASTCRTHFRLTDADLSRINVEIVPNPYYKRSAPMRFYRIDDVRDLAETVSQEREERRQREVTDAIERIARESRS